MILWLDAHLPPALARWLNSTFALEAHAVRDLGLRNAKDEKIFLAARDAEAIVMTKDADFAALLDRLGPPPQIVWLTIGNTSNAHLRKILERRMDKVLEMLLKGGESLVELGESL